MDSKAISPNEKQQKVIDRRTGYQLVVAGAGSGKTTTIAQQFGECIVTDGNSLQSLVSITFTEKAASELKQKIRKWLMENGAVKAANDIELGNISTIHSYCARLVREHSLYLGIDPGFTVIDEIKSSILKKEAMDLALKDFLKQASEEKLEFALIYGLGGNIKMSAEIVNLYSDIRGRGNFEPSLPELEPRTVDRVIIAEILFCLSDALSQSGKSNPSNTLNDEVQRFSQAVSYFEEMKESEQIELCAIKEIQCFLKAHMGVGNESYKAAKRLLNEKKDNLVSKIRDYFAVSDYLFVRELFSSYGKHYSNLKKDGGFLDFEDLQLYACKLLEENDRIRERLGEGITLFQIDEFQDTNALQLKLLKLVSPKNICLVGDRNQSIYSFRDADVRRFDEAHDSYKQMGQVNELDINYRSVKKILDFLNSLFGRDDFFGDRFLKLTEKNNSGIIKNAETVFDGNIEIMAIERLNAQTGKKFSIEQIRKTEAQIIAERISRLMEEDKNHGSIAILLRKLTNIKIYEDALAKKGVPYYLFSGRYYFSKTEVKDINCFLKILANPLDDLNFAGVLKSPFVRLSDDALYELRRFANEGSLSSLFESACLIAGNQNDSLHEKDRERLEIFLRSFDNLQNKSSSLPLSELIENIISDTGYDLSMLSKHYKSESIYANIRKLIREASAFEQLNGSDIRGFTSYIDEAEDLAAKEGSAPTQSEKEQAVKIMSVHAAKGLEFKHVFVADLTDKFEPSQNKGRALITYRNSDEQDIFKGIGFNWKQDWGATGELVFKGKENEEEIKREQVEEAKRIFYVAASRAEQGLYLSGGVNFNKFGEEQSILTTVLKSLDNFDHEQLIEAKSLCSSAGDADVEVNYYQPQNFEHTTVNNKAAQLGADSIIDFDTVRLTADEYKGKQAIVARVSASSLETFSSCEMKYWLRYIVKVSGTESFNNKTLKAAKDKEINAAQYGSVVHLILSNVDWNNYTEISDELISATVDKLVDEQVTRKNELINTIKAHISRLAGSKIGSELKNAGKVVRETPFYFSLDNALFEGRIDALLDDKIIIDFKTGAKPEDNVAGTGLELQTDLYCLALLKSGAATATSKLVYLDEPDEPIEKTYSQENVPELEQKFTKLINAINNSNFKPNKLYDFYTCNDCPGFKKLCSPKKSPS